MNDEKLVRVSWPLGLLAVALFAQSSAANDLGVKLFRTFTCNSRGTAAIAVDHQQRLAATGGGDNMVTVWDLQSSRQLRQWQPSPSTVTDLAFKPGSHLVASVSYPKKLALHDPKTNSNVWESECLAPPTRVAFSRDGSKIAVGSTAGKACIYDAVNGKLLVAASNDHPTSNAVEFAADGRSLFVAGNSKDVRNGTAQIVRVDTISGKPLAVFGGHNNHIVRIRLSPSGKVLVAVDNGGKVAAWNLENQQLLAEWQLDISNTQSCTFVDNDHILIGGRDAIATVKLGDPTPTKTDSTGAINRVAALADRGLFASAIGSELRLFRFDTTKIDASAQPMVVDTKTTDKRQVTVNLIDGANEPPDGIRFDGLVSREELIQMLDQPLAIKLQTGRLISKVTLAELQFDRSKHGLKFLKYREGTSKRSSIKVADLFAFWVGSQQYQLRYFPPTRQLFIINTKVADALAESRLAGMNKSLQERLTEQQQEEANAEHRQFLQGAVDTLKGTGVFHIDESETTLIFTDYPPASMAGVRTYVDNLNQQLNRMFGVPEGDSVFRGKPILAIFSSPAVFGAFEEKVMNNPNHGGRGGVRSGSKRFLQTAIAKKFGKNIARGLAWGYSLGFAQRLHSTKNTVPWLNMGIGNVVPRVIFPDKNRDNSQKQRVAKGISRARSLLGLLNATKLEQERWPEAGQLVQYLISMDAIAFSQLFRDVKLGVPLNDALQQNFGVDQQQLAAQFGRSLGVANVAP